MKRGVKFNAIMVRQEGAIHTTGLTGRLYVVIFKSPKHYNIYIFFKQSQYFSECLDLTQAITMTTCRHHLVHHNFCDLPCKCKLFDTNPPNLNQAITVPPCKLWCPMIGGSEVDPGNFNRGRKHFLRKKAAAPGCPHTVRHPVSAKIGEHTPVSTILKGGAHRGCPPLNSSLGIHILSFARWM